ncbi:MAG: RNA polymerase-binding protein DksA [Desulfobacteraceae bacterium]|nr:MAG: RNA polymerase-binding protein DksA [Desulfobacteraceae bacterium]
MNKKQTQYFTKLLKKQFAELQKHSGSLLPELMTRNGKEIEPIDCASLDIDQSMKTRIWSREVRLMKKIQDALERIENNSFGICESCGENISMKRLEVRPVATKCITCKTEEEKNELLIS